MQPVHTAGLPGGPPDGAPPPSRAALPAAHRPTLARIRTEGYAGYSIKYSPFFPGVIAIASSANFGLVGNGRLHTFSLGPPGVPDKRFDTQDGLFDVAWSELNENQLVTSSGDGSIKLWDIMLNDFPIRNWHEHTREVFCVDWGNIRKDLFASCSWDHTIKIWTPERPSSIQTINAHTACVYSSLFSPHTPDTLASCSSDGLLKIWDLKSTSTSSSSIPSNNSITPRAPDRAALTIPAHPTEVLSLDWNKYNPTMLATASVDRTVRIHDLRMASSNSSSAAVGADGGRSCIATLVGHDYAIRRVAWSPHAADVLASSGYDMTCRTWKIDGLAQQQPPGAGMAHPRMTDVYDQHREFVIGLAWSLFEAGVLATVSWDQECHVYVPNVA